MGKNTFTRRLFAAFSRYRPRVLTLAVLAAIAAVIWLANLSEGYSSREVTKAAPFTLADLEFDVREPGFKDGIGMGPYWNMSYGWPLLWRQYVLAFYMQVGGGVGVIGECWSASRLAGNLAIWLAIIALPAGLCEWLLRRYRPRLRFSLRTMLAATGLAAVLCGWFVAVRNRATVQDPLLDAIRKQGGHVWVERWGPKWLDNVGADPYRRRIVGAALEIRASDEEEEREGQRLLDALKRLPDLRSLSLEAGRLTREMAGALSELRRVEILRIEITDLTGDSSRELGRALRGMGRLRTLDIGPCARFLTDRGARRTCLAAVGNLPKLERLRLEQWEIYAEELALLGGLGNLKSLALHDMFLDPGRLEPYPELLSHFPALPRLETLDLFDSAVGDRDLRYLAALPRLKSLNLNDTRVTGAGLAELATFESLEELAIDNEAGLRGGFEALRKLKRLRKLHLAYLDEDWSVSIHIRPGEPSHLLDGEVDDWVRGLERLRKSNPELAVDGDVGSVRWDEERLGPKGETDSNRWMERLSHEAVQAWKEKQAGK